MIQRYDIWNSYGCQAGCEINYDPSGDYILAEDVKAELFIILNSAKESMAKVSPNMTPVIFDYINDAIGDLGL